MAISIDLIGNPFSFEGGDGIAYDPTTGTIFATITQQLAAQDGDASNLIRAGAFIAQFDEDGTLLAGDTSATGANAIALDQSQLVTSGNDNAGLLVIGAGVDGLDILPNGNFLLSSPSTGQILEVDRDEFLDILGGSTVTEFSPVDGGISFQDDSFTFPTGTELQPIGGIVSDRDTGNFFLLVDDGGVAKIREYEPTANSGTDFISEINLSALLTNINPEGIEIDPVTGNFLVVDDSGGAFGTPGNSSLHEISPDGELLSSISLVNQEGNSFGDPEGITVDPVTRTAYIVFDNDPPGSFLDPADLTLVGNQIAAFRINDVSFTDSTILEEGDELPFLEAGEDGGMPFVATTLSDGSTVGDFPVDNIYVNGYDTGEDLINPVSGGFTPSDTETFTIAGDLAGLGSVNIEGTNYVFINHGTSGSTDIEAFSVERAEDAGEESDGTSAQTQPKLEPTEEVIEGTINGGRISVVTYDEDYEVIGARNLIEIVRVADTGATNAVRNTVPVGGPAVGGFGIGLVFGEYALNPTTGNYEFSHVENGSPNTYSNDEGEEVNILGAYSGTDAADGTRLTWGELLDPTDGIGDGTNGEFATTLTFDAFSQMHLVDDGFRRRNGNVTPYVMTGEASDDGIAYFHIGNGTTVPINGFGSFNYGQIYSASEYRQFQETTDSGTNRGSTVLLATDNSDDGEIYMYLAPQVPGNVGGFADTEESLYVLEVQGDLTEGETTSAAWVLVDGNPITNVLDVDDEDGDGDTDELIPITGSPGAKLNYLAEFTLAGSDGLTYDSDSNTLYAAVTATNADATEALASLTTFTPTITDGELVDLVEGTTISLDSNDDLLSVTTFAGHSATGIDVHPETGNVLISSALGGRIVEIDPADGTSVADGVNVSNPEFVFPFGSIQTLASVLYNDNGTEGDTSDDSFYTLIDGEDPTSADYVGQALFQEYDLDGNLLSSIDLSAIVPGINPEAFVVDSVTGNFFFADDAGSLFTAADGGSSIHEISRSGVLLNSTFLGDGAYADPEGLAIDSENRILYVGFDDDSPALLSGDSSEVGDRIVAYELVPPVQTTLTLIDEFDLAGSDGLAYDSVTNTLYAAVTAVSTDSNGDNIAVASLTTLTPTITDGELVSLVEGTTISLDGNTDLESVTTFAGHSATGIDVNPETGNVLISSALGGRIVEIDPADGTSVTDGVNVSNPEFVFPLGSIQTLASVLYNDNGTVGDTSDDSFYTFVDGDTESPTLADGTTPNPDYVGQALFREYDLDGNLLSSFDLSAIVPGINPEAIVLDSVTGNFFVADDAGSLFTAADGGSSIHEISTTGELVGSTFLGGGVYADPEGLAIDSENRILYVGFDDDSPALLTGDTSEVGDIIAAYRLNDFEDTGINTLNSEALADWVNNDNSTNFVNPTDIAENPVRPGTFYFVAVGDSGYGELYELTLDPSGTIPSVTNDGEPPAIAADVTLLFEGTAQQSFDNLTVDANGQVILQGDDGIFRFVPGADELAEVSETDGTGVVQAAGDEFGYLSNTEGAEGDELVLTTQVNENEDERPIHPVEDLPGVFNFNQDDSHLVVELVSRSTTTVQEIGVFFLDADGTIDGVAPGSNGFATAALARTQVLQSLIANLPSGFSQSGVQRVLDNFDDDTQIAFVRVNDGTISEAIQGGATDIAFSTDDDVTVDITEGSDGFDVDFNGEFTIKIDSQTTTEITLPPGVGLQNSNRLAAFDFRSTTTTTSFSVTVTREAVFENDVYLYVADDVNGTVGGVAPNSDGSYLEAVLDSLVPGLDPFEVANGGTATRSGDLPAGAVILPLIIVDGDLAALQDADTTNDPSVFFPFSAANSTGGEHVRILGNNTFGFEDFTDGDYQDVIISMEFG